MVRVVMYGEKLTDIEGLEKMLCEILTENRRWPMIHTYISDSVISCLCSISDCIFQ